MPGTVQGIYSRGTIGSIASRYLRGRPVLELQIPFPARSASARLVLDDTGKDRVCDCVLRGKVALFHHPFFKGRGLRCGSPWSVSRRWQQDRLRSQSSGPFPVLCVAPAGLWLCRNARSRKIIPGGPGLVVPRRRRPADPSILGVPGRRVPTFV